MTTLAAKCSLPNCHCYLRPAPEDLRFTPAPATPQTANLPVTGRDETVLCCMGDGREAVCQAYYAELGNSARLLPWCRECVGSLAWKVVASGFSLTLLPMEPLPTYDEVKRQLDAFQAAESPAAYLRRQKAPLGRKPGRWL